MCRGVYPGTFDPITLGHLDVIERSSKIVEELVVGVLSNKNKTPLFSCEERASMIREATSHLKNVRIVIFEGLSVDFARKYEAEIIVRGLRAVTDFEFELQMSQTNRIMEKNIDSVFFTTSLEYAYLSSSTVKEVAAFGGDISKFVPKNVEQLMKDKYKLINEQIGEKV